MFKETREWWFTFSVLFLFAAGAIWTHQVAVVIPKDLRHTNISMLVDDNDLCL